MQIKTPRWSIPLLKPARYKGAHGGRGSGKSHFFAEMMVEECTAMPDLKAVCIREIQKSLKFSAKLLIEAKIKSLGVSHLFDITQTEIRHRNGDGLIIFQGMQDHTADSIKSLEGFDRAWVEEAQNLSARSLKLLRPTIRNEGSELWFSWNPDQPTDPVDKLLRGDNKPSDSVCVEVNYYDNPFLPDVLLQELEDDRKGDQDDFNHVWNGGYNTKSHAQVFKNKWRIDEFTPGADWDGPYHGLDFGFAGDPTAGIKSWIHDRKLFIEYDAGKKELELDATSDYLKRHIPGIEKHAIRADNARPESISYLRRNGLPHIEACKKGKGSVEDGVEHIKSYDEIIIHPRCEHAAKEFRLYSYKVDKLSGDILPVIVDDNNHWIDALRYSLEPVMRSREEDEFAVVVSVR